MDQITFALQNISYTYDSSPDTPCFTNVSCQFKNNRLSIITGLSGTGKSTLLRLLIRLISPQEGQIFFKGEDISQLDPLALRSQVVTVGQSPTLVSGSVRDNLLLPYSFSSNKQKSVPSDARMTAMLNELSLSTITLEQSASSLSLGQKQRLCLIRALLIEPEVLLMDEPASALDEESKKIVEAIAANYCTNNKSVIMISHHKLDNLPDNTTVFELNNCKIDEKEL
ncbi:MAG: ATP-binding cassette domain-containing protein [Desulfovibrio sp.]